MLKKIMNDETRALIVAFFPDIFTAAQLFGVNLTGDQVAVVMSLMTKFVVLVFYLYKTGQDQGDGGQTVAAQNKAAKK